MLIQKKKKRMGNVMGATTSTQKQTKQNKTKQNKYAPSGNRTQGKCLEGIYVTTTPKVLCLQKGLSKYNMLVYFISQFQSHNSYNSERV